MTRPCIKTAETGYYVAARTADGVVFVSKRSTSGHLAATSDDGQAMPFNTLSEVLAWIDGQPLETRDLLRSRGVFAVEHPSASEFPITIPEQDFEGWSPTLHPLGPLDIEICKGKARRY